MPWDSSRPAGEGTRSKYRSAEHVRYRKALVAQLERDGYLTCTAKVCVFDTRSITNPNGNEPDGLNAGHADNGIDYDGPQHRACNVRDGAVRGNQRARRTNRWVL